MFRGGLARYTITLNLGVLLFGTDVYLIQSIMPTVIADVGGMRLYTSTLLTFSVGSIIGTSSAEPIRRSFGRRNGYTLAGLALRARRPDRRRGARHIVGSPRHDRRRRHLPGAVVTDGQHSGARRLGGFVPGHNRLFLARDDRAENKMFSSKAMSLFTKLGASYWILLTLSIVHTVISAFETLFLQMLHGQPPMIAAFVFALTPFLWTIAADLVGGLQGRDRLLIG